MEKKKSEPVKHVLVPKHEKLSKDEAKKFLDENNLTIEGLPKILSSDAGIKHLDVKAGDIIKITRNSPTAGEVVYYRGVIDG